MRLSAPNISTSCSHSRMAQASRPLGAWDGWVLYTSESGHKYHWNHLTHESRWAVDEASSRDNYAEESFQAYIRQRASGVSPDDIRASRLDAVEAGEGSYDDTDFDDIVTPYAGTGPITMSGADRHVSGTGWFAARVSGALGNAMTTIEQRQHDTTTQSRGTSEWDPELGRRQRSRRHTSPHPKREGGGWSTVSSSSSSTSSGDSSSSSSSTSSGDSSSSSSSSDGSRRRSRAFIKGHRGVRGLRHHGVVPSLPNGTKNSDQMVRRSQTRHAHRTRGHRKRSLGETSAGKLDVANDDKTVASTMVEGMAGIGRQAMERVVKVAVRAVLGSWKGMTTVAIKALRRWQVHEDLHGALLPIAVAESGSSNRSRLDTTPDFQGFDGKMERTPFRSFLPKTPAPPRQGFSRLCEEGGEREGLERRELYGDQAIVEGFREDDGEAGCWVGGDGGVEEHKGGFMNPSGALENGDV